MASPTSWAVCLVIASLCLSNAHAASVVMTSNGGLQQENEVSELPLAAMADLHSSRPGGGGEGADVGSKRLGDEQGQSNLELPERGARSEASSTSNTEEGEQVDSAFSAYMAKHAREYQHGSAEYEMRKALFKRRLAEVHAQNSRPDPSWKAKSNHFSDRTEAERAAVRGYKKGAAREARPASVLQTEPTKLPETVSWKHLAAASLIRDQGSCGSCWAIAVTSMLDAHYEIYTAKGGPAKTFSPQQTLECTPNPDECGGQGGCQGATVELGMAYIQKNGIATEEEVPYTAQDGQCSAGGGVTSALSNSMQVLAAGAPSNNGGAAIGLVSYSTLPPNEDYPLAEAVAKYGPTAISASAGAWFEYDSGIFDSCGQDSIVDHAITVYGYGKEGDKKYWLIRNSWGPDWGEGGFIRMKRHNEGESFCGTDSDPAQGTGCKGGPSSVKICGMCGMLYDSVAVHFAGAPKHTSFNLEEESKVFASAAATAEVPSSLREMEDESSPRAHMMRQEAKRH